MALCDVTNGLGQITVPVEISREYVAKLNVSDIVETDDDVIAVGINRSEHALITFGCNCDFHQMHAMRPN